MSDVHQDYELVPLNQLSPHPKNPRRGDVEAVMASITANGWHGAIVVQRSTGYVLAGNTRLKAAKALGMAAIPVVWRDVDDATAERVLVSDNRATDLGYFDEAALGELLVSADDLAGMLYSPDDLELLGIVVPADTTDLSPPDEAGEGPERDGEQRAPTPVGTGLERDGGAVLVRETPHERAPEYVATGVRSIVLPLPLETYLQVVDALQSIRKARGYGTNAEAVTAVVLEAAEAM